jgi:hypothetical protein
MLPASEPRSPGRKSARRLAQPVELAGLIRFGGKRCSPRGRKRRGGDVRAAASHTAVGASSRDRNWSSIRMRHAAGSPAAARLLHTQQCRYSGRMSGLAELEPQALANLARHDHDMGTSVVGIGGCRSARHRPHPFGAPAKATNRPAQVAPMSPDWQCRYRLRRRFCRRVPNASALAPPCRPRCRSRPSWRRQHRSRHRRVARRGLTPSQC